MTRLRTLKLHRSRLIDLLRRTYDPVIHHHLKQAIDEIEEAMYDKWHNQRGLADRE